MTISGLKWLEPDVQPSILQTVGWIGWWTKAWLLETGCLNHQTSIHLRNPRWALGIPRYCFLCLSFCLLSMNLAINEIRFIANQLSKNDVFPRTQTLSASRAKPPPRFFSRCDSYVPFSRVTIHALLVPPLSPQIFPSLRKNLTHAAASVIGLIIAPTVQQ